MNPHNQAYVPRSQPGGHHQSFADNGFTNYGANASANAAPCPAQQTGWYNQGHAVTNIVATLPANYPLQPATNTNFDSSNQNLKSPVAHLSKSPTKTPRVTESLTSSFLEHTRREGPTANSCIICNVSFHSNSELESHAKSTGHSAFSCACDTSFGRYSSLARHINSNTGSGYHCGLCEDKTLPRLDKLYDHLRDGHKVSQKVLDYHKNKTLGRTKNKLRPNKPASTPIATPQPAYVGGLDPAWPSFSQINGIGMSGRHSMNMTPLSPDGVDATQPMDYTNSFTFQ